MMIMNIMVIFIMMVERMGNELFPGIYLEWGGVGGSMMNLDDNAHYHHIIIIPGSILSAVVGRFAPEMAVAKIFLAQKISSARKRWISRKENRKFS